MAKYDYQDGSVVIVLSGAWYTEEFFERPEHFLKGVDAEANNFDLQVLLTAGCDGVKRVILMLLVMVAIQGVENCLRGSWRSYCGSLLKTCLL